MIRKQPEQMERCELIGMVSALQREVVELTSPERTQAYTLGRLQILTRQEPLQPRKPARLQNLMALLRKPFRKAATEQAPGQDMLASPGR